MGIYSEGHICQCLSRISTIRRSSPVTISGNRQQTGEQFVDSVFGLVNGLLDLGFNPGDIVAISAFNSDWYLEWLLAVAFVGGIVTPLNYRWSFEEARYAMRTVRPLILVADESCDHWYSKLQLNDIPSLRWYVSIGSPSTHFTNELHVLTSEELKKHSVRSLPPSYVMAPEGAAIICFTSGTTGMPKGVTISHSALIVQSLAKIALVGYGEDDVYLHIAPLCHIGGLSSAMAMLMLGACHVFIPKFEVKSAVEAIEIFSVTSLITVPAMMADLVSFIRENDDWEGRESIKKILNGGGGLSIRVTKDALKCFPRAKLLSAYGMTETCSSLTFMTLYDPTTKTPRRPIQRVEKLKSDSVYQPQGVCVGKPAPHVELKISSDGSSGSGKILTRGPHVMLGYWDQSKASNAAWFDTGDVGSIDECGNLWLIGRTNGRIKSGGENIYPEEVETMLLQHPGVRGVVVVGVADARMTEKVVACVQISENWQWSNTTSEQKNELELSSELLRNHCKESNLTGFKIPKKFIPWKNPFPVTTMGKIKRDLVRTEVISHLRSSSSKL